ncbi:MAG: hypothetical protein ACLQVL_36765 [Terriglobia bacterium]
MVGMGMIVEPIVGIIHNVKLNKWHPVYFRESPPPSSDGKESCQRYKSGGHQTEGFATREEGLEGAKKLAEALKPHAIGAIHLALDGDFLWDGEDIPAMVVWFALDGETAKPMF